MPGYAKDANCDYKKAPFFNVLAAFWIQFMTHDWFSHLEEGHNAAEADDDGLHIAEGERRRAAVAPRRSPARLPPRRRDRRRRSSPTRRSPRRSRAAAAGRTCPRAPRRPRNTNTAWWDASQIYGYDERSRARVKRDPSDPREAAHAGPAGATRGAGERAGLPRRCSRPAIRCNPQWAGQEATAFPDNWTIGMSFYHNVFAREHNLFVDAFPRAGRAARPTPTPGCATPPTRRRSSATGT